MAKVSNPQNGYTIETGIGDFFATLFLGPIWFAIRGVWTHFIASILLALVTFGLSWLVYPFFSASIIKNNYLKKGWIDSDNVIRQFMSPTGDVINYKYDWEIKALQDKYNQPN